MAGLLIILTFVPAVGIAIALLRCEQDWTSVLALGYGCVAAIEYRYLGWIFLSSTDQETPHISASTSGS